MEIKQLSETDEQQPQEDRLAPDEELIAEGDQTHPNSIDSHPDEVQAEFAFKLINSVKAINLGELDYHEMVGNFTLVDELKCLFLFVKALPYSPIKPIYPEEPFLFFKGVAMPRSFDLTEETAVSIGTYMKELNSQHYAELRLHDLDQHYLDAYERGLRIYNDMVDKSRNSYHDQVKNARSQVWEISAAVICLLIVLVILVGAI